MPYLTQGHYQILAILLLFLYSRNSHNVDKDSFCRYIDKYVYPFLDGFPTERPYYQQLDYLHCTAFEAKETHFAEILSDSYPLLFRFRGFTEEELRKALKGQRIPDEFIVPSFNSPLVKLAMVDESMAKRFFRMTGINDRNMQDISCAWPRSARPISAAKKPWTSWKTFRPSWPTWPISGTARCCAYRRCRSWACT